MWDDDSAVWIATSEDVAGLVLEDESLDNLQHRVELAIPELLALNLCSDSIVNYSFISQKSGTRLINLRCLLSN